MAVCPQTNFFPSLGLPSGALSVPHHFLKAPGPGRSWWWAEAGPDKGRSPAGAGCDLQVLTPSWASHNGHLPAFLEPGKAWGWKSFLLPSRFGWEPLLT